MSASQNANLPFSKDEAMYELKEILFVQATQISIALNSEMATQFLGVEIDSWGDRLHDDDREKIDLKRFNIFRLLGRAYDYAFQTEAYWQFDGDDWYEISGFSAGVTPYSFEGSQSPYLWDDSKVRHIVDMAIARYHLQDNFSISIRGLSLLAAMTEPAVRNSLSKDGIQTSGKPASVENETARKWLSERRGFIETRTSETQQKNREQHISFLLENRPFPEALSVVVKDAANDDIESFASAAGIPFGQLQRMMTGEENLVDIERLGVLARSLNLPDLPKFVAKAIEFALRAKAS